MNYATWNVNLWINNEESAYKAKTAMLKGFEQVTAKDAETIATAILGGITPDLDPNSPCFVNQKGYRWEDVDWSEIAALWSEEIAESDGD